MNGDISTSISNVRNQLNWLSTLTTNAENHFWQQAAAERESFAAISALPRNVADEFCEAATESCEIILREIASMTNATHTPLDWATSVRTLNSVTLSAVTGGISRILDTIQALAYPPVMGYTQPPLKDAGADLYSQAVTWIGALGPKFMTPITELYPDVGVTGISAEVVSSTGYKLVLTVTGTTPEWPTGVGSSYHELDTGDFLVITRLDVGRVDTTWAATSDFAGFLNIPLEVSTVSGDTLTLVCPDTVTGVIAEAVTDPDAVPAFNTGFVVRKIRGNEA